jgi:PKD repeat protein
MRKQLLSFFISALCLGFFSVDVFAQCAAPIVAIPDTNLCGQRTVNFSIGTVTATTYNFVSSTIPTGWSSSPYVIGQPCITYMIDSSQYFWATFRTGGVRFVQTQALNVSAGGVIQFYMRYGSDDPDPGCEDPDLTVEGVFLQYSTNSGASWTNIQNWVPVSNKTGPLYVWTLYQISIPIGAASSSTIFRWFQPQNSGDLFDNWGLDDIFIQANIGGITSRLWNFGDSTTSTADAPVKTYSGPGNYNVSLTINVAGGCFHTATKTVVLRNDSINPVAVTRNIIRSLRPDGTFSLTPQDIDNGSTDNCVIKTRIVAPNTFNCSNIGGNIVTLTVRDSFNNQSSQFALLQLVDSIPPTIIPRRNRPVFNLDNTGLRFLNINEIDSASFDACGIQSRILIPNRVDCSDIGIKNITLRITDIYGNIKDTILAITVSDSIGPRARAKNATIYLDDFGRVVPNPFAVFDNGSTDNCPITYRVTPDTFTCAHLGTTTINYTVTDPSLNISTANAIAAVLDTIKPIAITRNINVYLNNAGSVIVNPISVNNNSTDNCTIQNLSLSKSAFNCTDIGINTVTLTVTDQSGNFSTAIADITVLDTMSPVIRTKAIVVTPIISGQATISVIDVDSNTTDNCATDQFVLSREIFTCADLGFNTVTLTVSDVNGNVAQKDFIVNVVDIEKPIVFARSVDAYIDESGKYIVSVDSVDNGSFDDCAIESRTLSIDTLTCNLLGIVTGTLYVTDSSGNIDSAGFLVTLMDTIAPKVFTKSANIYLTALGSAEVETIDIDSNSRDNCGIVNSWVLPNTFSCADTGFRNVQLFMQDFSGNISSASARVQVFDTIKPTVLPKSIVVYLDSTGQVTLNTNQLDSASFDNCQIVSYSLNPSVFSCASIGLNQVALFATDASGNIGVDIANYYF